MPNQVEERKGSSRFSFLITALEILLVIGLFGYPLCGLIAGQLYIPSTLDGGLNIIKGLEARTMASGMLLLFAGWAAIIRSTEANRKTWKLVGYVLMAIGIIGMVASFVFASPS